MPCPRGPPVTLSGKLIKNPPVRGLDGKAFIRLREGAKSKNSNLMKILARSMKFFMR